MNKEIDRIVEAFLPEMDRISKTDQSDEQKERQAKAWLRAALEKFANDVRQSERRVAPARNRLADRFVGFLFDIKPTRLCRRAAGALRR